MTTKPKGTKKPARALNKLNQQAWQSIEGVSSVDTHSIFGFDCGFEAPLFNEGGEFCPAIDSNYRFCEPVTKFILAGLSYNKRLYIYGPHGTGKSTHIEQICARLKYPCIRINLDSFITRADLIGRDAITLSEGKQVTKFNEGIIPYSMKRGLCLIIDEFDCMHPEVAFVFQRLLEGGRGTCGGGELALVEDNRILQPHPMFRIFATANTLSGSDAMGVYSGTNAINIAQLDRWDMVCKIDYPTPKAEEALLREKFAHILALPSGSPNPIKAVVTFANMTRRSFYAGDLSCPMTVRGTIAFCDALAIFHDIRTAIGVTYLNKINASELAFASDMLVKCFGPILEDG